MNRPRVAATLKVYDGAHEVGRYRIYGADRTEAQLEHVADEAIDRHPTADRVVISCEHEDYEFDYSEDGDGEERFHD